MSNVVKMNFDINIAQELDVNCAIILSNIQYWVYKNATNQKHFYEDRYWTYNSAAAYAEQFKWLTTKQIRTAINRLLDAGLLLDANHNASGWDRTKWYALTDKSAPQELAICIDSEKGKCILPNGNIDVTNREHRCSQTGSSYKEHIIITNENTNVSETAVIDFASDWMAAHAPSLYESAQMKAPKHVKQHWPKVINHFNAAVLKEELKYDARVLYGRLMALINNWKIDPNEAAANAPATRKLML